MTDKEYREQKKRVQKYIDKWFKTIGLGWFRVEFSWSRERYADSPNTAGRTTSSWQYKDAGITWYLPALAEIDDDHLENVVVHEFCHVLLSGLAQMMENDSTEANQINEYTTELVANALIWAREAANDK